MTSGLASRKILSLTSPTSKAMRHVTKVILAIALALPRASNAQVPFEWRDSLVFHTFSIAAIDPRTGEVGVAVTTRVPCAGGGGSTRP